MDDPRKYLATPAVQIMLALREALLELKDEDGERWERHKILADVIRTGIRRRGMQFIAEEGYRPNTLTGFLR